MACFQRYSNEGFTFVEILVGLALFLLIGISIYQGFLQILEVVRVSRVTMVATALANEQFEIIRNIPYNDVGLVAGLPPGVIPHIQNLVREGSEFMVTTTIRNEDDSFDGTIGGSPNDLSPADYKLVELGITCPSCRNFSPLQFTGRVAPRSLETASANGALFVQVFDANGQPVQGADVHIENNQLAPAVVIDDTTNNDGVLQIVDAPPSAEAYEITVSKAGYSSERTYLTGDPSNPNPIHPHATVLLQQVTQTSFAIDKESTLNFSSVSKTCVPIGGIDFSFVGSKLIGTSPDVLKYDQNHATDGTGELVLPSVEWDTYSLSLSDASYDLAGSNLLTPFVVPPDATQNVQLTVAPKNPSSLLVTVRDAATQLPLTDADVTLLEISQTLTTGRGFLRQTDWSGGGGQADFTDPTKYFTSDGNEEVGNPPGELRLRELGGLYVGSAELISSTFDTGSPSNFHQISWQPTAQPPETGPESIRFQLATNSDKATWNFVGPDGTASTFYTLADSNINPVHNGDRYVRSKVFLQTADPLYTPTLAEFAFVFTSSCVPPGQVLFDGLASATYTLRVEKSGYQTFEEPVAIGAASQQKEVILSP